MSKSWFNRITDALLDRLAGLATVVTEKLRPTGETVKIERMHITDAGRRALEG